MGSDLIDVDVKIPRSEIVAAKREIMAGGKVGYKTAYSEMLRIMSHPVAILCVRMIPGTRTLQWLLNTCIIVVRVGVVAAVILLFMRYWWCALGCFVISYIVGAHVQTFINYEIGARLFILDKYLHEKKESIN